MAVCSTDLTIRCRAKIKKPCCNFSIKLGLESRVDPLSQEPIRPKFAHQKLGFVLSVSASFSCVCVGGILSAENCTISRVILVVVLT